MAVFLVAGTCTIGSYRGDMIWNIIILVLGWVIGLTFADIDLAPVLPIKHRSAWTHGPVIPWLIVWSFGSYEWMWWFALGFLPAFSLHLLYDMFPKAWHGSAKINLYPIPLTLPALFSFAFLALAIVISLGTLVEMLGFDLLVNNYVAILDKFTTR